jgi:hypothetical protein
MSKLVSIPATTHTRLDHIHKATAEAANRTRALEALMPSISAFMHTSGNITELGGTSDDVMVPTAPRALEAGGAADAELDYEDLAQTIDREEGPVPYTDLRMGLQFATRVEVWIDTLEGLKLSETPVQNRFLFLFEPDAITKLRVRVTVHASSFQRIFSHDPETIAALPNASLFPHGGSWILPSAVVAHESCLLGHTDSSATTSCASSWAKRPKRFGVSFVCGAKCQTQGHLLRRALWERQDALREGVASDFFVSGARPGSAAQGRPNRLLPSPPSAKLLLFETMFHLAIENIIQKDYFSEKLLDCFLTRTIPIYWGCPNISSYFDVSGIFIVDQGGNLDSTADAIAQVINSLTPDDYIFRQEAIARNFFAAKRWINQRKRMEQAIHEVF